ncbi:hypothetical protein G6O69_25340 [Pseudenhygromyxa sp. WMMC2535]|uniref:hypothetical protein n=1 Tax=Pseudenhygromyxa sp. WMMC2535 TaxID=2712867 RepID=UPI0015547C1F|nr:hypothetical protein [Pseudenhygromyxa sp. WMMC2535]NVB41189.1 hypothetical protein [Pseudenhygromyxa sp. WMMC2535]
MAKDDDLDISGPKPALATPPATAAAIEGAARASAVSPSEAAGLDVTGDAGIAEALATGRIDAAQAQTLLIEQALAEQLPADASPELVEGLRAEISALLGGDPTLDALLRR